MSQTYNSWTTKTEFNIKCSLQNILLHFCYIVHGLHVIICHVSLHIGKIKLHHQRRSPSAFDNIKHQPLLISLFLNRFHCCSFTGLKHC